MSLRTKTLAIIIVVFFVLLATLLFISRSVILKGFVNLEKEQIQLDVSHALNEISNVLSKLDSIAGDWAQWDDTYEFIQNHNRDFIEKNLSVDALFNLGINFMLFVDQSKQMKFSKGVDFTEVHESALPSDLWDKVLSKSVLIDHPVAKKGKTGIVMLDKTPIMVASRAIVKSNFQGPIKGILIVGKYLDASEIKRISEATQLSLTLHPFNQVPMPPDFKEALSILSDKNPIAVLPLSKNINSGYSIQKDADSEPAFLLKIDTRRKIYNQGLRTLFYFSGFTLVIGFIFIFTTLLLLEKFILSPLIMLSRNVGKIGENGKATQRLAISRNDELGDLELSINMMLDRIQTASDRIKTLEGLIPICSLCKRIRDDTGFWQKVEKYVGDRTDAQFSHGICPECAEKHYPDLDIYGVKNEENP